MFRTRSRAQLPPCKCVRRRATSSAAAPARCRIHLARRWARARHCARSAWRCSGLLLPWTAHTFTLKCKAARASTTRLLQTAALLQCQKPFDALCNADELQFQIVHQVEELWMKLLEYTLLDIDEYLAQRATAPCGDSIRALPPHCAPRERAAGTARNDGAEAVSEKPAAAGQRPRAGVSWISRHRAGAAAHRAQLRKRLSARARPHRRSDLRLEAFARRCVRARRMPDRAR